MTMVEARPALSFSQDWVSHHAHVWDRVFHLLVAKDRMLEIGSFEGRSACWFLQNILSPTATLVCVDTWEGSPEFAQLPPGANDHAYERFQQNIAIAKGIDQTVKVMADKSVHALADLISNDEEFDIIYVDGSHHAADTLTDACMAWELLKQGGIMVFDDYLFNLQRDIEDRPKFAIDAFTTIFNSKIRAVVVGDQYIIRKI